MAIVISFKYINNFQSKIVSRPIFFQGVHVRLCAFKRGRSKSSRGGEKTTTEKKTLWIIIIIIWLMTSCSFFGQPMAGDESKKTKEIKRSCATSRVRKCQSFICKGLRGGKQRIIYACDRRPPQQRAMKTYRKRRNIDDIYKILYVYYIYKVYFKICVTQMGETHFLD